MYRKGQKLVCVDAESRWPDVKTTPLKEGKTYTYHGMARNGGLLLVEVVAGIHFHGFYEDRFRPAVEPKKKTDISVFEKLLNTKKLEELISD